MTDVPLNALGSRDGLLIFETPVGASTPTAAGSALAGTTSASPPITPTPGLADTHVASHGGTGADATNAGPSLGEGGGPAHKRRPKDIGTAAETAVVRFLQANGFPHAERRALKGAYDQGDITGTPGLCWEIKGGKAAKTASDGLVAIWLDEAETERLNARADIGVLVLQRSGIGTGNAGRWWAVLPFVYVNSVMALDSQDLFMAPVRMRLEDACLLLRIRGYGDES